MAWLTKDDLFVYQSPIRTRLSCFHFPGCCCDTWYFAEISFRSAILIFLRCFLFPRVVWQGSCSSISTPPGDEKSIFTFPRCFLSLSSCLLRILLSCSYSPRWWNPYLSFWDVSYLFNLFDMDIVLLLLLPQVVSFWEASYFFNLFDKDFASLSPLPQVMKSFCCLSKRLLISLSYSMRLLFSYFYSRKRWKSSIILLRCFFPL